MRLRPCKVLSEGLQNNHPISLLQNKKKQASVMIVTYRSTISEESSGKCDAVPHLK